MVTPVPGNTYPFRNMLHRMGGSLREMSGDVYRGLWVGRRSSARAVRAIEAPPLLAILPIAMAISAIIYQQGRENLKNAESPGSGDPHAWRKYLLESGLFAVLLENTRNIYPLWGLGVSAYNTGRAPNTLAKLQSLASTVLAMSFGYMGYHTMKGWNLMGQEQENHGIRQLLEDATLKPWITQLKKAYGLPGGYQLGQKLEALQAMLRQEDELIRIQKLDPLDEKLLKLREQLDELKMGVAEHFETLEQSIKEGRISASAKFLPDEKIRPLYRELTEALRDSTSSATRLIRGLNPVAGFVLAGTLLGGLAAREVNNWLSRRYQKLQQDRPGDLLDSHASLLPNHRGFGYRHHGAPSYSAPGSGVSSAGISSAGMPSTGHGAGQDAGHGAGQDAGHSASPVTDVANLYTPYVGRPGAFRSIPSQHAHSMPNG